MSLHRRPLGRDRIAAAISSVLILVGCALPWFRAGGSDGIPPITGNAFAGPGILVFLAALATLALVALPYAAGDRPVALDRWWGSRDCNGCDVDAPAPLLPLPFNPQSGIGNPKCYVIRSTVT